MRERFDRNVRFFGHEGQKRLCKTTVAVVGIGGIGTHVVQQLALLGVGTLVLIDSEEVSESNRNRYIGLRHYDPIPGTWKVDLGERLANSVDPDIRIQKVRGSAASKEGIAALAKAQYVFGGLDCEGTRLFLTEVCMRLAIPYVDAATDIVPEKKLRFGGRVCVAWDGRGCLVCLGVLDHTEAQLVLAGKATQQDRIRIYGVEQGFLNTSGPSVVSLNGVIASLAVTEFIVGLTGLRSPNPLLIYRPNFGGVTVSIDEPQSDCYFCKGIRGKHDVNAVSRFSKSGIA